MNVQEFIDYMTSRTSDIEYKTSPWFLKAKEVEVVEDTEFFAVYHVDHDLVNKRNASTLIAINKVDNKEICVATQRLDHVGVSRNYFNSAIKDLAFHFMVDAFYVGKTAEALLCFREYTNRETALLLMLESAYSYMNKKQRQNVSFGNRLYSSFMEYFMNNSRFEKKNLDLVLDSGLVLIVDRVRWIEWTTKEIFTRFVFRVSEENSIIYSSISEDKSVAGTAFSFEVKDTKGQVTSHNQLYKTFPDFKKKIDAIFS